MDRKIRALDGRFTPTLLRCLIVSSLCVVGPRHALAQVNIFPNTSDVQSMLQLLRAKAPADECFAYLALPSPLPKFTNPANCAIYATDPPAKKKVNQSYIWGVTTSGASIWFGTFANGQCITQAGVAPATPYMTESWVCEFGNSPYVPTPFPDGRIGDARPPRIYQYKQGNGMPGSLSTLTDKTPRFPLYVNAANNPEGIIPLLAATRGIRAAATFGDVILLAGPNLNPASGLTFFAWNKNTGAFLGARPALGYNNIRQFLTLNGGLYSAVGKNVCSGTPPTCSPQVTGGRIVRLAPSVVPSCVFSPTAAVPNPPPCFLLNGGTQAAPLPMSEVGVLDTTGGSLTAHNGRIFTVTWPSVDLPGVLSSLYMSPLVPPTGLTPAHAAQWSQLWKADDYEPDPFIAQTYAGGALASFDGSLIWGTLHIPMQPFGILAGQFPPATREEALQDLAGTFRSTVVFRGRNLDTVPEIDLLYGNAQLPVFTPPGGPTPRWALAPNAMGENSLWGPSGLGNPWNTYTWSAAVFDNRLWLGTMDWSFTAQQGTALLNSMGAEIPEELFNTADFGADLFYFTSANAPAFPESTNGVGNPTTYGIRNQVVGGNLFLGMANPMNRLTEPADATEFGGLGGWELDELAPNWNTAPGTDVTVNLPNGVSVTFCSVNSYASTVSSIVANPFDPAAPITPLLVPHALNGPDLLPDIGGPSELVLLWSSRWGQGWAGCADPNPAVSVPLPPMSSAPRLLQMQWTGSQFEWHDITTSVDGAAGKIRGKITPGYLGVLGVAPD